MSRAGHESLAAHPRGAQLPGQGWALTSPLAAVALPAPTAGVLGRLATADMSLVLPAAAGTGAASPTSPRLPCTPCGVPHLETGFQAAKLQRGQAWLKHLALAQGTALPAWPQLILGAVLRHAGSYWGRMRLMSRGISKD